MNDLKTNVLKKIKNGEVKRKPVFYFIAKDYFFWMMFIISIIVGAIGFSSILVHFMIEAGPWYKLIHYGHHAFYYIAKSFPLLWLFVVILFIVSGWFNYKHTKKAYKMKNVLIVIVSILISLLLGTLLFFSGVGRKFDKRIQHYLPRYRKYSEERRKEREEFLKSLGLDPEEFMRHRRMKFLKCKNKAK